MASRKRAIEYIDLCSSSDEEPAPLQSISTNKLLVATRKKNDFFTPSPKGSNKPKKQPGKQQNKKFKFDKSPLTDTNDANDEVKELKEKKLIVAKAMNMDMDEGGSDDDDVQIIAPPPSLPTQPPMTLNEFPNEADDDTDADDDIVIEGTKGSFALIDFPHSRYVCTDICI